MRTVALQVVARRAAALVASIARARRRAIAGSAGRRAALARARQRERVGVRRARCLPRPQGTAGDPGLGQRALFQPAARRSVCASHICMRRHQGRRTSQPCNLRSGARKAAQGSARGGLSMRIHARAISRTAAPDQRRTWRRCRSHWARSRPCTLHAGTHRASAHFGKVSGSLSQNAVVLARAAPWTYPRTFPTAPCWRRCTCPPCRLEYIHATDAHPIVSDLVGHSPRAGRGGLHADRARTGAEPVRAPVSRAAVVARCRRGGGRGRYCRVLG